MRRWQKCSLCFLALSAAGLLGFFFIRNSHNWGDDFASYLMQARAITEGNTAAFIRHNRITIEHSSIVPGPIAYPWGFPLLLAPIYAALGLNLIALKLPGLFCFLGFLVCLYLLARKSLPKIESVFVAAIFAFHPFLLGYLDQILSDIPYLFVSTLSLLYFYSLNTERRTSVIQAATFSLLMFFSLFTRTAGFTLLIGYLLVRALDAWRLRHKPAQLRNIAHEMFLILSITGTVLLASNFLLPSFLTESSYSKMAVSGMNSATAVMKLNAYLGLFPLLFREIRASWLVSMPLFICLAFGCWRNRHQNRFMIVYFSLMLFTLTLWPYWQGMRLLLPLLPLYVLFVFQGLGAIAEKSTGRAHLVFLSVSRALWLGVVVFYLCTSMALAHQATLAAQDPSGPFGPLSRDLYAFLQKQTPPEALVVFFKPRIIRLMANRDSIVATDCPNLGKADYLAIRKNETEATQVSPSLVRACASFRLKLVFENEGFLVFKVQK